MFPSGFYAASGSAAAVDLANAPGAVGETVPGYEVNAWTALCAPAGNPREVVQRLALEMSREA